MNCAFGKYGIGGLVTGILFMLVGSGNLYSQSGINLKAEGDRFYEAGEYQLAEEKYRSVPEEERSPELLYNLGNSLFKQERYEEARQYYEMAEAQLGTPDRLSDALYNRGNAHFEQGDFEAALEAYREALLKEPDHAEARNNLLLSRMMMDAMPPQPQTGDEGEDSDEPFDQEQDAGMAEEGDSDEEGEDMAEGTAEMNDELEGEGEPDMEETTDKLDDQRLEQLLQIAEQDDQQSRRKMNERQSDRGQTLKDW